VALLMRKIERKLQTVISSWLNPDPRGSLWI